MNGLFFVQFAVVTLALVGFALIVWALIEFLNNHVVVPFRDWRRDRLYLGEERLAAREDGVMHVMRSKSVKPAGLYDRWEPGTVKRRKLPAIEPTVFPINRQARR